MLQTAIIGGGAAGFFLAVCLKERVPQMQVTIFESGRRTLRKVKVSGGGRCNCTNSFEAVKDLKHVYPRGHRLMKRLMKNFSHKDAYQWWEDHGVKLITQDDDCVFPQSQSSQQIIDCLQNNARKLGVKVQTETKIESIEQLSAYNYICVATGGMTSAMQTLLQPFVDIEEPVPSLFTFAIDDKNLHQLSGIVAQAAVNIPATKFAADGPLLITHWGLSGPAALKLSSHAARYLHQHDYRCRLSVNWLNQNQEECRQTIQLLAKENPKRLVENTALRNKRLWQYLLGKALGEGQPRWMDLSKKDYNRLVETLCNDQLEISGRAAFKDEFVTCGGVSLSSINSNTLECRNRPGLFFAGEILDIDGITGGFNFQAAWTTAYCVAQSIASRC